MTPTDFKNWRKAMGLTQAKAAEVLDLSPSTIEFYEAGKRRGSGAPAPIPRTVALACAALAAGIGEWHQLFPGAGLSPRLGTREGPEISSGSGVKS